MAAVFDKRDGFNFHIVNMNSNIPSKPAYGVYISQLVRIGRTCDSYKEFFTRHHRLTCRLPRVSCAMCVCMLLSCVCVCTTTLLVQNCNIGRLLALWCFRLNVLLSRQFSSAQK